jgi:hypothetical protein
MIEGRLIDLEIPESDGTKVAVQIFKTWVFRDDEEEQAKQLRERLNGIFGVVTQLKKYKPRVAHGCGE